MLARLLGLPIFIFLFIYGLASRFTSSEFWPITISKTWLTPSQFETSMIQKPLLTLFFSFFHLIKMPDLLHLLVLKIIFSAFCTYGLYVFIRFILKRTGHNLNDLLLINIIAALFALSSPTYVAYFFSLRSDQVACILFSLFLLFCEDKKQTAAFASLALIPLFGVKEILFLIPGSIYYISSFKINYRKKTMLYLGGLAVIAIVWIVALNIPFLYYLFEAYEGTQYWGRFDTYYFKQEKFLIVVSVILAAYIFVSRQKEYFKEAGLSLLFLVLLLAFPQSYYFYMASFLPFIYLPIFIFILRPKFNTYLKLSVVAVQIILVIHANLSLKSLFFESVFDQYKYITRASQFVGKYKFSYMDGIGILPQQKFYPCFVSPFDNQAKSNCLNPAYDPQVIIITNRLAELGEPIFQKVHNEYTQIFPNLWVLNSVLNESIKREADLTPGHLPLPILIF